MYFLRMDLENFPKTLHEVVRHFDADTAHDFFVSLRWKSNSGYQNPSLLQRIFSSVLATERFHALPDALKVNSFFLQSQVELA